MKKAIVYYQIFKPLCKNTIHKKISTTFSMQDIINLFVDNDYIKSCWIYDRTTGEIYIQATNGIIRKILEHRVKKVIRKEGLVG